MISKSFLTEQYVQQKQSAAMIAKALGCSENKVTYWLGKHAIPKRSISDAVYLKNNPTGDPFAAANLKTNHDWFLYGLGLGLYWGEGTKANQHTVRLGNSDPSLVKAFIVFLVEVYQIDQSKLKFGLQVFNDMSKSKALDFWLQELGVSKKQFQKVVVTPSRGKGTYRKKTKHGVVTVHFNNKKLRDIIVDAVNDLQKKHMNCLPS